MTRLDLSLCSSYRDDHLDENTIHSLLANNKRWLGRLRCTRSLMAGVKRKADFKGTATDALKPKLFSIFETRPPFVWLPDDGVKGRPKTCLVGKYGNPDLTRRDVGAFDLDGCLIKPKSGHTRPGQADDWMFWNPCVPKKLQELHSAGKQLVIFSNQNYDQQSKPAKAFKEKLKLIARALDVPFYIFAGYEKDSHRKPFPGMWNLFKEQISGCDVDLSSSFFVGDAAGRKGDHSGESQLTARKRVLKTLTRYGSQVRHEHWSSLLHPRRVLSRRRTKTLHIARSRHYYHSRGPTSHACQTIKHTDRSSSSAKRPNSAQT